MLQIGTETRPPLMAMAVHDLRQPLQVIGMALDMIGGKAPPGAVSGHLESAWKAVHMIEGVLNSLLATVQTETTAVLTNVRTFPLRSILDEIEEQYRMHAEAKGLRLRVMPSSASVCSDQQLLASILQNLVGNAIKYTDRGTVLVGCRRRPGRVEIQVLDTGKGIPADQLDVAFKAFTQLDSSRSDGVGLGLFIVRRLAEALGHRLSVHSVPGGGSCFGVEVPSSDGRRNDPLLGLGDETWSR